MQGQVEDKKNSKKKTKKIKKGLAIQKKLCYAIPCEEIFLGPLFWGQWGIESLTMLTLKG